VRWTDDNPRTARLHCPACNYAIDDAERVASLSRGTWVAEHPERVDDRVASFHVWEAYSPFSSLSEIVSGFLRARKQQKAGDASAMHTWQNTTLGEPLEPDDGTGVDSSTLLVRREVYEATVPAPVRCLTMGVDTQDDRLEALVYGWGPHEESWLVHRAVLPGDTSQAEPWAALAALLDREFPHEAGSALGIHATCIDSAGHRTQQVYDFVKPYAARRVYATIGRDGQRPLVSSPSVKRTGRDRRKVPLYTVGVDAAKALFVNRLSLTKPGRGYVHLPATEWCDEELVAQLTSERLQVKFTRGRAVQVWRKTLARNEALDYSVLAIAALRLLNPNLDEVPASRPTQPRPVTSEEKARTPQPWISPRSGDWFGGRS